MLPFFPLYPLRGATTCAAPPYSEHAPDRTPRMLTHNFDAQIPFSLPSSPPKKTALPSHKKDAPARDASEGTMSHPSRGGFDNDVTRKGAPQNTIDQHGDDGDAVTQQRK